MSRAEKKRYDRLATEFESYVDELAADRLPQDDGHALPQDDHDDLLEQDWG